MLRLLPIFLCLVTLNAFSQTFTKVKNPSVCKNAINVKAKNTTSITANFDELMYSSMYNQPKKASGKLNYKKSNKIRWEHITPKKQIVLIDGTKVRLFEDGKEVKNATSNQVIKKVQSLMMQLFSGDFLNEKEFSVSYYESSTQYKLILKPKNSRMAKYISEVEMYFDKKSLQLAKMTMLETDADKVEYSFSSVTLNSSIPDSNFTKF